MKLPWVQLAGITQGVVKILAALNRLQGWMDKMDTDVSQIGTKLDTVLAEIDSVAAIVTELKGQVGQGVDPDDKAALVAINAKFDTAISKLSALVPQAVPAA